MVINQKILEGRVESKTIQAYWLAVLDKPGESSKASIREYLRATIQLKLTRTGLSEAWTFYPYPVCLRGPFQDY